MKEQKKEDFGDFQRIIKKFSFCKPILHRDFSTIEISNNMKEDTTKKIEPIHKKIFSNSIKEFYHLQNSKYQNYKYVKYNFNKTFLNSAQKNGHFNLKISKENTIENVHKLKKNENLAQNYQNNKNQRILNSRYENYRKPKTPFFNDQTRRATKIMGELKHNIQKINETQISTNNLKWVSPYLVRLQVKEKMKTPNKLSFLEICIKLYQDIIKMDVEKNIRLTIFSSNSQKRNYQYFENKSIFEKSYQKNKSFKEDYKFQNILKGIEDERISIQSFQEYFHNYFSDNQWERLFFSLKIPSFLEEKVSFESFLLFCRIFLNQSASFEEKFSFLKRSFQYPEENIENFDKQLIENILYSIFCDNNREEIYFQRKKLLVEKTFEVLNYHHNDQEFIDEIIKMLYSNK